MLKNTEQLASELDAMILDICCTNVNVIGGVFKDTSVTADQVKDLIEGYNYKAYCMGEFKHWWGNAQLEQDIGHEFDVRFGSTTVSPDYQECVKQMTIDAFKRELESTASNTIDATIVVVQDAVYEAGFITNVVIRLDKKEY